MGSFISYDAKSIAHQEIDYMRVRVRLDVRKPLMRRKKLINDEGEAFFVRFKYERLILFCFLCGRLSHHDSYCDVRLHRKGRN